MNSTRTKEYVYSQNSYNACKYVNPEDLFMRDSDPNHDVATFYQRDKPKFDQPILIPKIKNKICSIL
jgi:hypothetical protein